jgi:hypothetical protein
MAKVREIKKEIWMTKVLPSIVKDTSVAAKNRLPLFKIQAQEQIMPRSSALLQEDAKHVSEKANGNKVKQMFQDIVKNFKTYLKNIQTKKA